jgi:homogentisate 1,2-dioxygenase
LSPAGIPHGPHPGAYEGSSGVGRTEELAVMLDTVRPLAPTAVALTIEDAAYHESFMPPEPSGAPADSRRARLE